MERQKHVDDTIESVFQFLFLILMNDELSNPNGVGYADGNHLFEMEDKTVDKASLWYKSYVRSVLVAILNHRKAKNYDVDPMSTHELDAENLEKDGSAFRKMLCHPAGRRIVVTRQSQDGDENGEDDLNNQPDPQQPNFVDRKIGTFDLRIKPKKKVRVGVCDRRKKMLEKVIKAETLETFLEALGLGKYSLIFQSEAYDMRELLHVTDRHLVDLGIPVGPGRKILQALKYKA